MEKPESIILFDFFKRFPDEEAARRYFEACRWINGKYCPHCGSVDVVGVKDRKPMPYRCKACRKHFSVRTDTVLEESRLPMQKWLMAMHIMTAAHNGIPSAKMARELGITQKSAWFLAQRIREAFLSTRTSGDGGGGSLSGEVEAEETYIGGKERNKYTSKRLCVGRGTVCNAIVGGNGRVFATILPSASARLSRRSRSSPPTVRPTLCSTPTYAAPSSACMPTPFARSAIESETV